ncbi:YitT family protein [Lapidilactobacillus achengensis]|uniref:YitT family protein n=1 Tax=Lapidilactobacillus achengensis TaxID=2486000 RepID=A0ABW1ULV4_9LACO|nr:YitT family protein [Lapidilactobacillus achengensis]
MSRFVRSKWAQFLVMLVALEIIAISINMFYAPHNIASGGATGIGILLEAAFGFNLSLVVLIINIFMLILAWIFLSKQTVLKIALGSFILPVCLALTPQIKLIKDPLLTVIVGASIFAVGISMLYQIDASSGGTTVPPLIIKKYWGLKTSTSLLLIDGVICLLNVFVAGFEVMVLAVTSQILTTIVMNFIETGFDRKKVIYIMSDSDLNKIKGKLGLLGKALTIFNVTGGYTGHDKEMLMVIVENPDYHQLLGLVHEIDPSAFVLVMDAAEARGGIWNGGDQYLTQIPSEKRSEVLEKFNADER